MSRHAMLYGAVAILLMAAALRLVAFGQVPPGLYHDEAQHGLDALEVLEGRPALYFAANNGREPLFIYTVAATVGLMGRSPFALRMGSFFTGTLTVATTVALGRALFSRRVGLLAGAVLAVTLWHVHLSRVGFRAVLLPLLTALALWQGARGARTGRRAHWLAAGALYALSFYTYTASRLTPLALGLFALYALWACRHEQTAWPWRRLGWGALAALVVLAPLALYTLAHPVEVLGRPGQVSALSRQIHGGDPWGTLAGNVLRTLGMFFLRGDRIWRHNVPWRPVFDPLLGAAFLAGVAVAVRRLRENIAMGLVLIWVAVLSLATLLAEDAPHFLRAAGVLPLVCYLPALGLDALARRLPRARLRWAALGLPLLIALGSTARAYFVTYAREPMTGYWFERASVALAGDVNGFLGAGWDGARMVRGGDPDRRAYVDPRLWHEWPQMRFLVAAPERLILDTAAQSTPGPVAAFAWPYEDWRWAWDVLPHPAEIEVKEGPLSQGDRDPAPYTTYVAFYATPADPAGAPLARFSGGVELLGGAVVSHGDGLGVQLRWHAAAPLAEDYTIFVHYLRDGARVAQADARPAQGYYPTTEWRAGDVVRDLHPVPDVAEPLPGRDVVRVGFWQAESGQILYLLDAAGNPAGDWIDLPVEALDVDVETEGF